MRQLLILVGLAGLVVAWLLWPVEATAIISGRMPARLVGIGAWVGPAPKGPAEAYQRMFESERIRKSVANSFVGGELLELRRLPWGRAAEGDFGILKVTTVPVAGTEEHLFVITVRHTWRRAAALLADRYASECIRFIEGARITSWQQGLAYLHTRRAELERVRDNEAANMNRARTGKNPEDVRNTEAQLQVAIRNLTELNSNITAHEGGPPDDFPRFKQVGFALRSQKAPLGQSGEPNLRNQPH